VKIIAKIFAFVAIFIISARGQGFVNLDFESAYDLPWNPGNGMLVPITNALPGWAAFDDTAPLSQVFYVSNYVLGSAEPVALDSGSLALSGGFSVELFGEGSISQTGLVPNNSLSLEFEAQGEGPNGSLVSSGFSVSLGGQTLSYSSISQGLGYTLYGANIPSALDSQVEPLVFECQGPGSGEVVLDNIEFSPSSVPEPAECALIGLGLLLFGLRRRNFKFVHRSGIDNLAL
jgi:hypothetical protein